MTDPLVTAYRVVHYLRRHGLLRGCRQLLSVYRQLHELRLGEFKGRDEKGNEFYSDPFALHYCKRRFVLYADDKDYDASDVSPQWRYWLHHIGDETPEERPFRFYEWNTVLPRNRLSRYGFYPSDIAPPGYLPRIIHEEPTLPARERRRREVWQQEVHRLLERLWTEQLEGIQPSPVELALLSGEDGLWWIRRHRFAGVDDLYAAWRREMRPLPGLVPLNLRRTPSPEGEWGSRRWEPDGYLKLVQEREKRVEEELKQLMPKAMLRGVSSGSGGGKAAAQ